VRHTLAFACVMLVSVTASADPIKIIKQGMVRVDIKPDNTYVTKAVRPTELAASYPPPAKPSSSHVCKRADLDTQVIGASGGEVYTKGACDAGTAGPNAAWPLKAVFQMTKNVETQAGLSCRIKWAERKRNKQPNPNNPFMFANHFTGKIHIRYCFLDMKPKKSKGKKTWSVDCGKDGIHREYRVQVSYLVSCVPPR
jgi:hypothetical protein